MGLGKRRCFTRCSLNSYRILSPRIYDFKNDVHLGYAGDDFMNVDPYFISDKKEGGNLS